MGDILHSIGIRWQLVLAQLIGFLIVLFVLKTFLFGRIQKVLADRAAEEERRKHAIAAASKEAAAAKARLDARAAEIDKQAYERTQAEVRAGLKRKSDVAGAALDKARDDVTAAREKIARAHDHALETIRKDVAGLAMFVAGRSVGRKLEGAGSLAALAEKEAATGLEAKSTAAATAGGAT